MSQKKYEFPIELPLDVLLEFAQRAHYMAQHGMMQENGQLHRNEDGTLVFRIGTLSVDRTFHRSCCPGNVKRATSACGNAKLPIQDAGIRNVVGQTKTPETDVDGQQRHISSYTVRDQPMCTECRKMKFDKTTGRRIR